MSLISFQEPCWMVSNIKEHHTMEDPPLDNKFKTDYGLCFICQTKRPRDNTNYIETPSIQAIDKLITITSERYGYGESEFEPLYSRLHGSSANELLQSGISYHKNCYKNFTNKICVDRARAKFEKGTVSGGATTIRSKKRGRPLACDSAMATCSAESQRNIREQCNQKSKCVFCQEVTDSKLHDVSTKNMGAQIKTIGIETSNESLRVRLSSVVCSSDPLQAVAEDMKYHLPCLVKAKREIDKAKQPQTATAKLGEILSDLQILDIIETELNDASQDIIMNMNDIHEMYTQLLQENDFPVPNNPRYKPYLKQLILDNIPDVHFSRPPDKTKPEELLSTRSKDHLIASLIGIRRCFEGGSESPIESSQDTETGYRNLLPMEVSWNIY